MKVMNLTTLILVVVGGINWGLMGLFDVDLVALLFGAGSPLARIVYIVVAECAVWQLVLLLFNSIMGSDEAPAVRRSLAY